MCQWIKKYLSFIAALCVISPVMCQAEIDRVYHPYVIPLERELEWRMTYARDLDGQAGLRQMHRFAVGYSVNDYIALEAYLIGAKRRGEQLEIEGYELEALVQLTGQGEFWADWAALFEVEREDKRGFWEAAAGLLMEKEWGQWSMAANLKTIFEFGPGIQDELETALALQQRYRLSAFLEPGLEWHWDELQRGIGPVFMGLQRFGFKKLKWEIGILFTRSRGSGGTTLRSLIEYEF